MIVVINRLRIIPSCKKEVKVDHVVCPLAGVHISYEMIANSRGWHKEVQLPSLSEMIMFISSASSFDLLSFTGYYAGFCEGIIAVRYSGMAVDSQYASMWALHF